jgi:hypothetical protein
MHSFPAKLLVRSIFCRCRRGELVRSTSESRSLKPTSWHTGGGASGTAHTVHYIARELLAPLNSLDLQLSCLQLIVALHFAQARAVATATSDRLGESGDVTDRRTLFPDQVSPVTDEETKARLDL